MDNQVFVIRKQKTSGKRSDGRPLKSEYNFFSHKKKKKYFERFVKTLILNELKTKMVEKT